MSRKSGLLLSTALPVLRLSDHRVFLRSRMPFGRDWKTLQALQESSKGKLLYSTKCNLEDMEVRALITTSTQDPRDGGEMSIKLSPYAGWVLDNVLLSNESRAAGNEKPPSQDVTFPLEVLTQNGESPSTTTAPSVSRTQQNQQVSTNSTPNSTILQTPRALEVTDYIRLYEEAQKMKTMERVQQRAEMMTQLTKSLAENAAEQLKRKDEVMELNLREEQRRLQEQLERDSKEALGQQEQLKEEHKRRAKLLSLKLREAEQQRQQELERARQEEGMERSKRLYALYQEAIQLLQQIKDDYKPQETLRLDLSSYLQRGNKICGNLFDIVRLSNKGVFPSLEDVSMGEQSIQEMKVMLSNSQREAAAAEERRKAEEAAARERQKEAERQQQAKAPPPAPAQETGQKNNNGLQKKAARNTMQKYQHLQGVCDQCLQAFSQLNACKDPQTKKIKADLQKAVTIPVSQISTISGSQLREVFDKINNLLLGKQVVSGGRTVAISQHPQGLDFVCYKLAEKFVKQGEQEVASHHEAAFPIAVVASGIWERHPRVGDLFLAHLHKKCPYAVPFYPSFREGTLLEDYQRMLGYTVEDSKVEPQDNFLKRMSGMIRLYAAIIQLRWPYGSKQTTPHPHGLDHGWRWLAQVLDVEPLSDVTATLLYDFLEVCGNALMKQYKCQFWKLILLIHEEYFPRIESITSTGQMGSVTRLRQFLENALQRKEIPLPSGYLQPSFWRT